MLPDTVGRLVPADKHAAVERALRTAFGSTDLEDIRPFTAGLSTALVFRIVVAGRPCVLRVIMSTLAVHDPARQFTCMRLASERSVAPRVLYASVEDRTLITEFIEAHPLPAQPLRVLVPALQTLHSLPAFPRAYDYLAAANRFAQQFLAAKLVPESATRELFRRYDEVVRAYGRDERDFVSTHNDLKPENILFDGRQIWLIDWEAAALNDRYVDLSIVANFHVRDEAEEARYLQAYFGEAPGDDRLARFLLMRFILHVFYATCFMTTAAAAAPPAGLDGEVPEFRDFHNRILSGEISLAGPPARWQYGRVHLAEALRMMTTARFEGALARKVKSAK